MDVIPFGSQNTSYIDDAFMKRSVYKDGKRRSDDELISLLVAEIFFNSDHPENKNITQQGDQMLVWNGSSWETRDLHDVGKNVVQVTKEVISRFINSDMSKK